MRQRVPSTFFGARIAAPRSNLGPRFLPRLRQQPVSTAPNLKAPSDASGAARKPKGLAGDLHKKFDVPLASLRAQAQLDHLNEEAQKNKVLNAAYADEQDAIIINTVEKSLPLPTLWLRDKCACPRCVDPDSGQKNFSTTDIADKREVDSVKLIESGDLHVVWRSDAPSGDALHESTFAASEVSGWVTGLRWETPLRLPVQRTLWNRATYGKILAEGRCRVTYEDWVNNEEAFWKAFGDLAETGLVFVTGVPEAETAVEGIAERVGEIQHTFYGRTWDVRSKPKAENVAYTSQFLGLHQDLMYHNPIPRLQFLHCLANSCAGGESLFSDGVRAAYEMREFSPQDFHVLETIRTGFHYDKGGHYYNSALPLISVGPSEKVSRIQYTHWAPPFQAPFPMPPNSGDLVSWKRAATEFQRNIEAPDNMVEVKLQPGECVIFDNHRLLHGRRQFAAGEGHRWLKGTYISGQVYEGKERQLQQRRGVVLPAVDQNLELLDSAEAAQAKEQALASGR
ncbi:hypothetical protein OQA88_3076 [Cercophora sp. LCS_1]